MIRYFVMDVDGTLTDGKIYMGPAGEVCKAFSCKDGYGIRHILLPQGITPAILTGRTSDILLNRCREMGVQHVRQGLEDKLDALLALCGDLSQAAYIGDDMNDFSCMRAVKAAGGLVGCPADAAEQVRRLADFIAPHRGGDGAVRDFIEWLLPSEQA
ncbi:MAG: 3-deoxy-D-manno-octulosonate 8-phosphate phosphatase [Oscillospiraceae bacterium]|nr:3-deoxy-D-manno-octulosonate 8-phosphate phosphatase [Oscillospiraceae bacterium]